MRTSTFIAAGLVAAASASVVRQDRQGVPALGGDVIPEADRVCTKSGEKCAGAAGQPEVVFSACCDSDLACGVPTEAGGLWGMFCILPADVDVEATAAALGEGSATTTAPDATTVTTTDDSDDTPVAPVAGATTGSTDDEDDAADASDEPGSTGAAGTTTGDADPDATDDDDDASGTGTTGTTGKADATDEDDGSVCFPADATVELESGAVVRMADLSVGDMVKVGVNEFSRVFMFTHKMADETHTFVSLKTESGASLELTSGHYLYANGALVAAKTVSVGDVLTLGNGETSAVAAVGTVEGTGLFNPQTVNGNVVVNGVVSSTYTTTVEPSFAHAILAPFRMLNNFGFSFTALESGGGVLADVAPRGQAAF